MKIAFLTAEYNPFHSGHAYHISETRRMSGADTVIAVMSGNFSQRGIPAVLDKYTRAETAVRCGADCVIELPFPFAAGAAPEFAMGAVKIMNAAAPKKSECFVSFGSESGDLQSLTKVAEILSTEPQEFKKTLQEFLSEGLSYPAAQKAALLSFDAEAASVLSGSNDILAVEYLKAVKGLKSSLIPLAVKRKGDSYIKSATDIRTAIENNNAAEQAKFLPAESAQILSENILQGATPDRDTLGALIQYTLRTTSAAGLARIYDVSEGLENRMKDAALASSGFDELLEAISTKRYSRSHIQRILLCALAGLTETDMQKFKKAPPYVKILALKSSRKDILSEISKGGANIVTRSDDYFSLTPVQKKIYDIEKTASEIYTLLYKNKDLRIAPQNKMRLIED